MRRTLFRRQPAGDTVAAMRTRAVVLFVCLASACGGGGNSSGIPDECNPLGGQGCLMPWPSMMYAKEDATSATGYRLSIPRESMPINADGIIVEPDVFNRWDGFSAIAPLLAMFPTGVSAEGLPTHKNPAESLALIQFCVSDSPGPGARRALTLP